jgi:hypothetical protein
MVSIEMVDKLKFPRMPHDTPYKVYLSNEGKYVLVNEKTWVELNIGGYKDIILCDIFPMDVCHFLLGRPWKFHRHAMYDGRRNTYEIRKDGVSILTSLKEEGKGKTIKPNVMMVGRTQFIKVEEEKHMEVAATSKIEGTKIVELKKNLILEGNNVELKVKDELIW